MEPSKSDSDTTVHGAFERTRKRFPAHSFIHIPACCLGGPTDLTYEQAGSAIERLIELYRSAGYGRSHHVAVMLESRADFYLHWLALNALGATLIPIGVDLVEAEISYLLQHGDADLLVTAADRSDLAQRAAQTSRSLPVAILRAHDALPPAWEPRSGAPDPDRAAIVFTSGSTGRPKGCVLSNEYFLTFGRWYRDLGGRCALRIGCERLITPLPPNHVNALAFSSMGAIMTGGCIVQLDRFRPGQWWQAVRESRATVMHYLGVMPGMLLKLPSDAKEHQHELRFAIGGGIRGAAHWEFEDRFGVPLIEAWAMTETGGAGTISTHIGPRQLGSGCIGRPSAKYAEASIVDERGESLPPGVTGELVVRAVGSNVRKGFFSGYYRDPQATESAWSGGWLHTGDLAMKDEAGSIFFVGRRKQLVRRSGENISVIEVESVLGTLEHVRQVAVVPIPDEIREEEVFACLVLDAELLPTRRAAEELMRQAAERLSYFKLPGYIAFVSQLPMTTTQKLRYGAIIELAQSLLAARDAALFDLRDMKRKYRASH